MQKQLNNVTVLVVEDEPIIAFDLQFLLEASGARPVALEHAMEGARQRLAGPDLPDVVILDLILGGKVEPASRPRSSVSGTSPSCSSQATPSASRPGSPDVQTIEKPFDADQLIATVSAVAGNHRAVDQIQ